MPNSAYNAAYGTNFPDIYANQLDETLNLTGQPQSVAQVKAVLPGQNYTTPPTVTFFGGGGTGAAATATLNGVVGITLVTAGTGYSANPTVTITAAAGDTGTGATAAAIVTGGMITGITIVNPGSNYLLAPTVTITDPTGAGATATANITLGSVGAINVTSGGSGYTKAPYVYLTGGGGTGAQADAMLTGATSMDGKNLVEGMDMEFGRMNAVLGSTPNPLTPLVGLGPVVGAAFYIDPPTEILTPEKPLLWRLAHIGVDSHAIHFHLFDVQVVNRVDWTGIMKPPEPEEIGWKDTVRTRPVRRPDRGAPSDCRRHETPVRSSEKQAPARRHHACRLHGGLHAGPAAPRCPGRSPAFQRDERLRLGVRLALSSAGPRRKRHDEAHCVRCSDHSADCA